MFFVSIANWLYGKWWLMTVHAGGFYMCVNMVNGEYQAVLNGVNLGIVSSWMLNKWWLRAGEWWFVGQLVVMMEKNAV